MSQDLTNIYFFPGQGSDYRVFQKLSFPENYALHYIDYGIPEKGESIKSMAQKLDTTIDQSLPYIFIGHSLGGMIACEMADTLMPELVIICSSAKTRNELPKRYLFQSKLPLYQLVPKRLMKAGALTLQPIVEPDRKHEKDTFKAMLKAKNPTYMKRSVGMIINWNRTEKSDASIIHIHGDNDHTIPPKNVQADYWIEDGSHMMILTRAEEINEIILQELSKLKSK